MIKVVLLAKSHAIATSRKVISGGGAHDSSSDHDYLRFTLRE